MDATTASRTTPTQVDVTVVIGTFGDESWRMRGAGVADNIRHTQTVQPREIIAYHGDNLADARNTGALRATSRWLAFIDADDALHPDFFMWMSRHLHRAHVLLNPSVQFILPEGPQHPRCFRPRPLREGNYLVIGTMMERALFHRAGGFDPRFRAWEDWPLLWRCVELGADILRVHRAIYQAYWRSDSRNNTVDRPEELRAEIIADFDEWKASL